MNVEMDDKFGGHFGEVVDRYAAASNGIGTMDVELNSELRQIESEISCCKSTLQSCRDKYESVETEICDVQQLQQKARFVLSNVRLEEEDLHERFKDMHLSYEACIARSGGYEDRDEMIRVKINELTMQRTTLMEELAQLKKNADVNGRKLARVKAMIAEQEEKNTALLRRLKEKSNSAVSIPQDIKKRIDAVLEDQEINESDDAIDNTAQ